MIFDVKNPGKKIKSVLTKLGSDYEIKVIDAEQCIYRNLQNGHDIEVSGLNNAKKDFKATVYVWDVSNSPKTVETISNIKSEDELKTTLDSLVAKYS